MPWMVKRAVGSPASKDEIAKNPVLSLLHKEFGDDLLLNVLPFYDFMWFPTETLVSKYGGKK